MKTILAVCAVFIGATAALTQEQFDTIMTRVNEVGISCAEKEHGTEADMADLMNHQLPSSHSGKCIIACFYDHFKMMKSDSTFDKQATIDAFKQLQTMDSGLHGKILQVIDTCYDKRKIVDDRCETAALMAMCVRDEADALGILNEVFLVTDH